jgi:hypothetical protein
MGLKIRNRHPVPLLLLLLLLGLTTPSTNRGYLRFRKELYTNTKKLALNEKQDSH